jgi:hypothetical protein
MEEIGSQEYYSLSTLPPRLKVAKKILEIKELREYCF